jgi:molecular chaperone DnaK (HSP70)
VAVLGEDVSIETAGGLECLVPKGTVLNGSLVLTRVFTNAADGQTTLAVRLSAADPTSGRPPRALGQIVLAGVEPTRRSAARVELRLTMTVTGSVRAEVRDLETGKSKQGEISPVTVSGN